MNDQSFLANAPQILGAAYTFRPSLAMRHHLTKDIEAHHSSKYAEFSYFYKGNSQSIACDGEQLYLRRDPLTNEVAVHWPEPELAIMLGASHEISGYCLANDLTAMSMEMRGRVKGQDGTRLGKVWFKSGSLGPRLVPYSVLGDAADLTIGIRVNRAGRCLFEQRYNTSLRLRSFDSLPNDIVVLYRSFGSDVPPSKSIALDENGFLQSGTVIMLGTGIIVKRAHYCQPGDCITVYCNEIGELKNTVVPMP